MSAKTEQNTSTATNMFSTFTNNINQMMEEQFGYAQSFQQEWQNMADKNMSQFKTHVDDYNKLMQNTFTYQSNLAKEWQKLGMDAARQSMDALKGNKA